MFQWRRVSIWDIYNTQYIYQQHWIIRRDQKHNAIKPMIYVSIEKSGYIQYKLLNLYVSSNNEQSKEIRDMTPKNETIAWRKKGYSPTQLSIHHRIQNLLARIPCSQITSMGRTSLIHWFPGWVVYLCLRSWSQCHPCHKICTAYQIKDIKKPPVAGVNSSKNHKWKKTLHWVLRF